MQQARAELASMQARFCFSLSSEGEIFGLLLIGNKASEQFTSNDIGLLITLVKSLSLIVNQIRLKTQVQQATELDLLGKMSRGMAHDLNNLLTPVRTLLQLSSETGNSEPLDEELLPVALRNVGHDARLHQGGPVLLRKPASRPATRPVGSGRSPGSRSRQGQPHEGGRTPHRYAWRSARGDG
ncbi:MAG: hypothetical protein WDN28_17720 [Chthoniobacter sp.]